MRLPKHLPSYECPLTKRQLKRKKANTGHEKKKAAGIIMTTLKNERVKLKGINEVYNGLYAAGRATPRAPDGSYYVLGALL